MTAAVQGAGHQKATDFVNTYQDPFGKDLSSIYDPIQKAQAAGTLTYQQANDALTSFNQQWQAFDAAAQQWKAQGGEFKTVVDQAYDPNGDFMKTVNMVKTNLTDWTNTLQAADPSAATDNTTPSTPPDLQTILAGLGITPADAARQAVVQQSKQAMAAPGYSATLLGGSKGTPTTKTKTLLAGYSS